MVKTKKPKTAVDFVNEERIANGEVLEIDNKTAEQHFVDMRDVAKQRKNLKSKERYYRNKHKKSEPSTPPPKLSIPQRRLMSLREQLTWKQTDISEDEIKVYATEQLAWALKDDSINLTGFYMSVGVSEKTYLKWLTIYPDLKEVHEAVKAIIGQRREALAIYARKYQTDPGTIQKTLRVYDSTWRQVYDEDVATKLEKPEPIELKVIHHTSEKD